MTVHKSRIVSLIAMLLFGACMNCMAQSVTLKFNNKNILPSDPTQCLTPDLCWTYEAVGGNPSSQSQAFSVEGDRLWLDTVKMGLWQLGGGDNAYHLGNVPADKVVEASHSFSITVGAKVLDYRHFCTTGS